MRNTHLVDDEIDPGVDLDDVDLLTLEDRIVPEPFPPLPLASRNQELPPEEFCGWG